MSREALGAAAAVVLAVLLAIPAVQAFPWGAASAASTWVLPGLFVVALVGLPLYWAARAGTSSHRVRIHTAPTHDVLVAARHEHDGHRAVGQALGARVTAVRVFPDGSGYTELAGTDRLAPAQLVAIAVAGEIAAGTSSGCGSDHRYRDAVLRQVPAEQRSAVRREAYALARRHRGGGLLGGASAGARRLAERAQ